MIRTSFITKVKGRKVDDRGFTVAKAEDEIIIREGQDAICEALRRNAALRKCNVLSAEVVGQINEDIHMETHKDRYDIPRVVTVGEWSW